MEFGDHFCAPPLFVPIHRHSHNLHRSTKPVRYKRHKMRGILPTIVAMCVAVSTIANAAVITTPPKTMSTSPGTYPKRIHGVTKMGVDVAKSVRSDLFVPITYQGGPVMVNGVNIYLIFYGHFKSKTRHVVKKFVKGLGGSDWWRVSESYYDKNGDHVNSKVKLAATWTDAYSQGTTITDVPKIVQDAIAANADTTDEDPNGIYIVLTSKDVKEGELCQYYCGYHTYYNGVDGRLVKYSLIGDPMGCPGFNGEAGCLQFAYRDQSVDSVNRDRSGDGFTSIMAHEITEAATDPDVATGWYDADGEENADKCNFNDLDIQYDRRGAAYNVEFATGKFLIQANWSADQQKCLLGQ